MMKALSLCALAMTLCVFAPDPASSQEAALSADQAQQLFKGNTEQGEGRKDDVDTGRRWTAFYAVDGTARKVEVNKGKVTKGTWFTDPQGRNCFQWENKDAPKCDVIVPDGDHYLRIRDGQVRGRIKIQEGNPSNL
jgi:hypothetical protein